MNRSTHSVAELHLSPAAWSEIARKLREAGYDDCFGIGSLDEGMIDMTGIGIRAEELPSEPLGTIFKTPDATSEAMQTALDAITPHRIQLGRAAYNELTARLWQVARKIADANGSPVDLAGISIEPKQSKDEPHPFEHDPTPGNTKCHRCARESTAFVHTGDLIGAPMLPDVLFNRADRVFEISPAQWHQITEVFDIIGKLRTDRSFTHLCALRGTIALDVDDALHVGGTSKDELMRLRDLEKQVTCALDMCKPSIRVREGAGPEDLGKSIAVTLAKLERDVNHFVDKTRGMDQLEMNELMKNLPNARPGFVEEVKLFTRADLQKRILIQHDWLGSYSRCIDGLDLKIDGKLIGGSGVDSARDPKNIRYIVEAFLHKIGLKDEVTESLTIENERLYGLINSPQIANFLEAVKLEAAHQRERWGSDHDAGKSDVDWLFLIGFLGGKGVEAGKTATMLAGGGDLDNPDPAGKYLDRRLHHIIAAAAACLNWHDSRNGGDNRMRPGILDPDASPPNPQPPDDVGGIIGRGI